MIISSCRPFSFLSFLRMQIIPIERSIIQRPHFPYCIRRRYRSRFIEKFEKKGKIITKIVLQLLREKKKGKPTIILPSDITGEAANGNENKFMRLRYKRSRRKSNLCAEKFMVDRTLLADMNRQLDIYIQISRPLDILNESPSSDSSQR